MKLSFSIENWKETSWADFCGVAEDTRVTGIELYDIEGPVFQGKGSPTNPELAAAERRRLINRGLSIPCLNTVGDFTEPAFIREMTECLEVAVNLGIDHIGIHTEETDQDTCALRVRELLALVGDKPVTVLVETADAYADTARLRDLLNRFADDRLAALWDMHTTCVVSGEDAETTITNLGAYVHHVHIHDFRRIQGAEAAGSVVPELLGEGELPVGDLMNALRSVNYDGFISLEWDPDWMPGLEDIEIMLTHFASTMRRFESTKRNRKHLYRSNRGVGQYVWKKGTLIDKTFP